MSHKIAAGAAAGPALSPSAIHFDLATFRGQGSAVAAVPTAFDLDIHHLVPAVANGGKRQTVSRLYLNGTAAILHLRIKKVPRTTAEKIASKMFDNPSLLAYAPNGRDFKVFDICRFHSRDFKFNLDDCVLFYPEPQQERGQEGREVGMKIKGDVLHLGKEVDDQHQKSMLLPFRRYQGVDDAALRLFFRAMIDEGRRIQSAPLALPANFHALYRIEGGVMQKQFCAQYLLVNGLPNRLPQMPSVSLVDESQFCSALEVTCAAPSPPNNYQLIFKAGQCLKQAWVRVNNACCSLQDKQERRMVLVDNPGERLALGFLEPPFSAFNTPSTVTTRDLMKLMWVGKKREIELTYDLRALCRHVIEYLYGTYFPIGA